MFLVSMVSTVVAAYDTLPPMWQRVWSEEDRIKFYDEKVGKPAKVKLIKKLNRRKDYTCKWAKYWESVKFEDPDRDKHRVELIRQDEQGCEDTQKSINLLSEKNELDEVSSVELCLILLKKEEKLRDEQGLSYMDVWQMRKNSCVLPR